MLKKITPLFILLFPSLTFAQFGLQQYFDGADTNATTSIIIHYDSTSAPNIWQVGKPHKNVFDSAATFPNAIVTDTINTYPVNDTSAFYFGLTPHMFGYRILALRWKQKLDMDTNKDGGMVEFSLDTGKTWQSVFNSPYVYNFYGFDTANVDTLGSGEYAFTGTDSTWKDIWLCYDISWLSFYDTVLVRFNFKSDSVDNGREGWMIDNLMVHITWVHTVDEFEKDEYIKIFPNPTTGRVNIETRKTSGFHIIEKMELINLHGEVVQEFGKSPVKFYIDIGHHPPGNYLLKITTNKKSESFRVILQQD